MSNKREILEKLIGFIKKNSYLLLLDADNNTDISKNVLKILKHEYKYPEKITFISSDPMHFRDAIGSASIRENIPYAMAQHRLTFYTFNKQLINEPPADLGIVIVYPIDEIKEKLLVKFLECIPSCKRIILISDCITSPYKHIAKLYPYQCTLQEDSTTSYYNKMKTTVDRNK